MPINIPDGLPAKAVLERENIFVMSRARAASQDIRPLRILLFNLMPDKVLAETQFLRLLGNTPLQVEVDFLATASYTPTHTSRDHLLKFYETFDEIKERRYDGMIITGAPVERLDYRQVDYWEELTEVMKWSLTNVYSSLHVCWAAQAGLYYHYGIPKYLLPKKKFGVFPHTLATVNDKLFRGFDDIFFVPHARHTEVRVEDVRACPRLEILSSSEEAGVFVVADRRGRQIFIFGHAEYDAKSLEEEYKRDISIGVDDGPPVNYYPADSPAERPVMTWRSAAHLLFSNWLNYYVYQDTPYDLGDL
jgi:homoserine O-succinyltransferase